MFDEKILKRFWAKVEKGSPDECWNWTAFKTKKGYGRFSIHRRIYEAPKVSYWISGRTLPPDKPWVLHSCDNPSCVNPFHLFAGNFTINTQDCKQKNRFNRHTPWVFGEKSNLSKLREAEVLEIRRLCQTREATQQEIGRRFGITKNAVGLIHRRLRWKHI